MQMTAVEIECAYRQAKNKSEQIKILADRNLCTVEDIQAVLIGTGKYAKRGKGLYPAITKLPSEQVTKQEFPEKQAVMDWKDAIVLLNQKISDLMKIRNEADRELAEIAVALGALGRVDDER